MMIKGIEKSRLQMPVDRMMEDFGMSKAMTVREIVEKYLKENGFGGLHSDDRRCCCTLETEDVFMCCLEGMATCHAGWECSRNVGCIVPEKPEGK